MDLKQLRALITVAETGNVTRAAESLHLVQPAVSRQLKLLEDDVGTVLFARERHGMVLTDAGKIVHPNFANVVVTAEAAPAPMMMTRLISFIVTAA